MFRNQSGFTLIEMLMVVLLVSILALVAIPQFIDFQSDAKNAATSGALGALRTAIANQKVNMVVRCAQSADAWPPIANITANDITSNGTPCTTVQVVNAADRVFLSTGIPVNPWGNANTVTACSGGCAKGSMCDGASRSDGWCYKVATGEIWADSASGNAL